MHTAANRFQLFAYLDVFLLIKLSLRSLDLGVILSLSFGLTVSGDIEFANICRAV